MYLHPPRGGAVVAGALLAASLATALTSAARADDATPIHSFSANVALTSNYMFRGVSQTDDGPAIQGGFDYEYTPLGLYAGVWASNVDSSSYRSIFVNPTVNPPTIVPADDPDAVEFVLQNAGYDGASMEIDVYAGWRPNWEAMGIKGLDALRLDIGYQRYNYPNSGTDANNTNEWHISIGYDVNGWFTPTYTAHYSEDYFGLDEAWYHNFELEVPLPYDLTLHGNYGLNRFTEASGLDYDDYSAGLSYSYGGFDFDLTWVGRSRESLCASPFRCGDTAVFTLSRSF